MSYIASSAQNGVWAWLCAGPAEYSHAAPISLLFPKFVALQTNSDSGSDLHPCSASASGPTLQLLLYGSVVTIGFTNPAI